MVTLLEPPVIANPLREGMRMLRTADPCAMVIFGITGDLAHRKLLPALYNLYLGHQLPGNFSVIGFARRPFSDQEIRDAVKESVEKFSRNKPSQRPAVWESFAQGLFYVQADFDNPDGYKSLGARLKEVDEQRGTGGNRVYYLSTPPNFYSPIIANLGRAGLSNPHKTYSGNGGGNGSSPGGSAATDTSWRRIVVEKPFGRDLQTAQQLNRELLEVFNEDQVYRIDHYLGKETVQNILVFRFANGIWEPIWNRRYIDHIQITVAESLGVEERASYYDTAGALRDMVQNHMMQLLTLVTMEPPTAFEAQSVRDEKSKVLHAIKPFTPVEVPQNVVRGQYGPGAIFGRPVPGYRQEDGVPPDSTTETYVAARFYVDNWRWSGVPFYLRHGKRLPKRRTEIAIQFRPAPLALFQHTAADEMRPNVLVLHIQPDEGISIQFQSKVPGQAIRLRSVEMNFQYGTSFGVEAADAYERLIFDCVMGDSTLFTRRDEVELMWKLASGILDEWQMSPPPAFPNYPAGSWGPLAADHLIERDGRTWRRL